MSVTLEERTRTVNASDEILGPTVARGRGGDIAILFGDEAITFDQLDAEVNQFGNALRPHFGKGDRALLLLKDSPVFVAAFLGIMRIGAVAVPISTRLTAEDLAFVMADSGAKALIIDDDFLPAYRRAIEINGRRPDLVAVRGRTVEGTRKLDDVLAGVGSDRPTAATTTDDMAYWLYSSGTTGRPKATIHVHGNLSFGNFQTLAARGLVSENRLQAAAERREHMLGLAFTVFACPHRLAVDGDVTRVPAFLEKQGSQNIGQSLRVDDAQGFGQRRMTRRRPAYKAEFRLLTPA